MLRKLDLYLLRSNLGLLAAFVMLALSILMLERLIRITDLISGSDDALMSAARMIANLLPHYLGMALPGALLIATIISVERLSRSGEVVALMSTGVSLYRFVRPFFGLAVALLLASIVISGFLQPVSRYNYRSIVHELKQNSIVTAFQERKFVQFDNRVVWTSSVDFARRSLGATFILETAPDGGRRFLTGNTGRLTEQADGSWLITLQDAMVGEIPAEFADGQGSRINTARVNWRMPTPIKGYRDRGDDERELTLTELFTQSYLQPGSTVDPVAARASLHDRLSRAALLLVLPFVSVVLGLNVGRMVRSGGLVIGILLLLLVQKMLEFGLSLAQRGIVPPWAGTWPVVALVAAAGLYAFHRAAMGQPIVPDFMRRRQDPRPDAKAETRPAA